MKIVHINSLDRGGAALCMYRIHKALENVGVESSLLLAHGNLWEEAQYASPSHYPWSSNFFLSKIQSLLFKLHLWPYQEYYSNKLKKIKNTEGFYSLPVSNYIDLWKHPLVQNADIVHLHWVREFLDYPSFFQNCKKPIVWTLHDENPIRGILHYSFDYMHLPKVVRQLDNQCLKLKKKYIQQSNQLCFVAISRKMYSIVSVSNIGKGKQIALIHNGVNVNIFKPSILKTFTGKITFLFSSYSVWDERKGLKRVIDALSLLNNCGIELIVVGCVVEEKHVEVNFPIYFTGCIDDQSRLAELYSSVDFYIQASYEESFGQTPLEAMACGTPVISTPCGISPELIKAFNGVLCTGFDTIDLKKGIEEAMKKKYDRNLIRQYIIENFDYGIIANRYVDLYEKVLQKKGQ